MKNNEPRVNKTAIQRRTQPAAGVPAEVYKDYKHLTVVYFREFIDETLRLTM